MDNDDQKKLEGAAAPEDDDSHEGTASDEKHISHEGQQSDDAMFGHDSGPQRRDCRFAFPKRCHGPRENVASRG